MTMDCDGDDYDDYIVLVGSSPFLHKVDDILTTELKHMPARYSLTALLNTWVGVSPLSTSCFILVTWRLWLVVVVVVAVAVAVAAAEVSFYTLAL